MISSTPNLYSTTIHRPFERTGKTYLVYSNYPSGAPVDDVKRKDAKDAIQSDAPGIQIDERHLVFGRVKVGGRDTGAVVYPISDSDARLIENTVKANKGDLFRTREEIDNKIIPSIIQKDMAKEGDNVAIYDIAKGRVLMPNEIATLSRASGQPTSQKITTSRGKAFATSAATPEKTEQATPTSTAPPVQGTQQRSKLRSQTPRPLYPQQRLYARPNTNPFALSTGATPQWNTSSMRFNVSAPNRLGIPNPPNDALPSGQNTANIDFQRPGEGSDYMQQPYPSPFLRPLAPGQHAPPFPGE
jgi:hypothetical protein